VRLRGGATALVIAFASAVTLAACGGAAPGATSAGAVVAGAAGSAVARAGMSSSPAPSPRPSPSPSPVRLPAAGNPAGQEYVPPAGRPVSTSHPDHVIGDGTPASCTSQAVVAAVAAGGVITFSCGPRPVTIMTIEHSALLDDPSAGFETAGFPGIFYIGRGSPAVISSTLG